MPVTLFTDLPDLVILDILRYLTPDEAIRALYDIDKDTKRILNLLIESGYFSSIQNFRLTLFNFICDQVLPSAGSRLCHLTLYDYQLAVAHRNQILSCLPNIISLHLKNVTDVSDNNEIPLSYFLQPQLKSLSVEFLSEHHIDVQAYVCEQFVFNSVSENLMDCQLTNKYGIQLRHLNIFPNHSIQRMTINLKELSDLHLLFDHIPNIQILDVELLRWTIEDVKYDYTKLPKKLAHLTDFSFQTSYGLSFTHMLTIIYYLIYLRKLAFIYRNYDANGIDVNQLLLTLNHLHDLTELHFFISFIYFNFNPKLSFENHIDMKQQWNVHTYNNSIYKSYQAYTQPFIDRRCCISSDFLLEEDMTHFTSVTNLSLKIHKKNLSLSSIVHILNTCFPYVTHLHIVDAFGTDYEGHHDFQLAKIHSLDASELKVSHLLQLLLRSMPNLTQLHVNANVLIDCKVKFLFIKTTIKHLELVAMDLDKICNIIPHFSKLQKLIVNCKQQSHQFKRKPIQIVFSWLSLCSSLYRIHVKADKMSELLNLSYRNSEDKLQVQCSNEMLTVWK